MTRRRHLLAACATVIALGATACSAASDRATSVSLRPLPGPTPVSSTSPTTTTTTPPPDCTATASIRPDDGPPPPPMQMPPDSTMRAIQDRGYLIVGVDQGTLNWGYRDPVDGTIKGLDVDLLRRIATAIFGSNVNDDHIQFKTVTTAERISAVQSGKVDMVASLLTATCARWQDVDFSTVYYDAEQRVLVPDDSPIQQVSDLAGKRVCATQGSTSITNIRRLVPKAKIYPVATRTDCLVALQEGTVDAITSDDTILASFEAQDKAANDRTLGALESEPYAIAINKGHRDLVMFVNAVLEQMREDGSLAQLYRDWLHAEIAPPQPGYQS